MKKVLFSILFLFVILGNSNAQNLLLNPSFEYGTNHPLPPVPPYSENGGFVTLYAPSTNIANWTVLSGSVDWIHNLYWQATEGTYSININKGSAFGSASFLTNPGSIYLVEFDLSSNPVNYTANLNVTAGSITQGFSFNGNGKSVQNMGWVRQSFSFTASGANTNLIFADVTSGVPGWFGPAIDNVSVTLIPEPGTILLLGSGFLGLGFIGWYRRRKL